MQSMHQMERERNGIAVSNPDWIEADKETEFHRELEQLDEQAMVAEIQGTTVFEDMFYETKDHKAALTWKGTKELRNLMRQQKRPISVVSVDVVEVHYHDYTQYGKRPLADFPCTKYCKYIGKSVAELFGERSPAEAEQTVLMEVYDRDKEGKRLETTHFEVDPFGRSKVVSKSKRNSIRDFIPELVITTGYEKWKALKGGQRTKMVGHGEAKAADVGNGAAAVPKIIKYFETSDKKFVKLPRGHPLYDEFAESCASLVQDHPEVEYEMRADQKAPDSISSVLWKNVQKGSELEKNIDDLIKSIADGLGQLL